MKLNTISNISYSNIQPPKEKVSFGGISCVKASKSGVLDAFLNALGNTNKANINLSDQTLEKLFLKNGFSKNSRGQVYKNLDSVAKSKIDNRFGMQRGEVVKDFFQPASKEIQNKFKEFLSLGSNIDAAKTKFDDTYILFSSMFESFKNYDEIIKIFKDNPKYSQLLKNLAENPVKKCEIYTAISKYKGVFYEPVNKALRNGTINTNSEAKNIAEAISSFLETQTIKSPIRLYRGEGIEVLSNVKLANGKSLNLAKYMKEAKGNEAKINKIREFVLDHELSAHQKSFMSTSLDKDIAKDFASSSNDGEKVFWILETRPNTKGAYIDPLNIKGNMNGEKEVLLQKNSDIKIKDIKYNNDLWYVKAEVSN